MPITTKFDVEKKEAVTFDPLPEDVYQVELLDITSEERATYDTKNKPKSEQEKETILKFQFTLLEGKDGEDELRGRNLWMNFVPTYLYDGKNGKNKLYQITEALLGHSLTLEEEACLDSDAINKLIGKQCRVMSKQKKDGDKVFDNIAQYLKATSQLDPLTAEEKENAKVKPKEQTDEAPEITEDDGSVPEEEIDI